LAGGHSTKKNRDSMADADNNICSINLIIQRSIKAEIEI